MKQTLLAYAPCLTTSQILGLSQKAKAEDIQTLYLQEIAVSRLPKEERSGMLASLPFAGLMSEQLSYMLGRAMALECSHFTFALPAGYVRDGRFEELEQLLFSLKKKARLILVPTIVLAELSQDSLKKIISLCLKLELHNLCLGTGTALDEVTQAHGETALNLYDKAGISSTTLEIACSIPDCAPFATHRICLSQIDQ